ncbi:MAG: FAD-dependent monooxygenase [Acidimicrobiaceae bacterium]|nr:FAD-dependent monooxygenase [Acidimicrobiaceae bacterium]
MQPRGPDADEPSIAVIGAGIGGLALAACLLRLGRRVRIYEQATAFARVGTGIQMGPNAMKVLTGLGLRERLEPVAYSPPHFGNREWDSGEDTFSLPIGVDAVERYGAPYYMLHRGDLHQALQGAVPAEVVQLRSRLIGIEPAGERVRLRFEGGTTAEADFVVGADGVHSVVREQVFTTDDATYTGRMAYRAVFPTDLVQGEKPGPATKWWGIDRHIVIYYVSAGREVYFTTSVPEDGSAVESWSALGRMEDLLRTFEGFHPEVQRVLEACPSVHKWAIYDRGALATWHDGHVVLLGDSCHPMTPYMAQGAATALEDAVVLSRCLTEFGLDDPDTTFEAYEHSRKPRTTRIQESSRANTWLRRATDPSWVYAYDAWQAPLPAPDELLRRSGLRE